MTGTRLRKVISDFFVRPGRTLLTLLGLIVGLYGVGAVLVAFTVLANDLDENFRRTLPPNVVISATGVSDEALASLRSIEGVTAVENRASVPARIDVGLGRWMPINLFVVEDFDAMRVARFLPQQGSWPPPKGGVLIERSGRFWVRDPPGVDLRIRIGTDRPVEARLAGFVFDAAQAPSTMDRIIYGYVTPETYRLWSADPPPARLLLRVDTSKASAAAASSEAEQALRNAGAIVHRTEFHEQLEHPHQFQLNSIVAMLAALALFAFVMCAVLIVNLIDSVMAHEQRSIGILRALGGRPGQIVRDYLLGVALLGILAGALSLPLALWTGRGIAQFAAMAVNFDLITPEGPGWLPLFVLTVASVIPAAVAFWRIRAASVVPVRDALARVEPGQRTSWSDRFPAALRFVPLLQRLALRALARQPRRTILSASMVALGVAFFMTALNVRASMLETVDSVKRTRPYDVALAFREAYPVNQVRTWLADFPQVRGIENWALAGGDLAIAPGRTLTNPMPVYGVPRDSKFFRPDVIVGRWLDPQDRSAVVVSQAAINDWPQLRVGDTYLLRIAGGAQPVRLAGVVKDFGEARLYAPLALLQRLGAPQGKSNYVLVSLAEHDSAAQDAAIVEFEESVAASDWQIVGAQGTRTWERVILAHLVDIGRLLAIIAGIALFIGAMGLASSTSVGVIERYREIAVLKAIGARNGAIATIFMSEAFIVALIGAGSALVLAPWLSRAVAERFGTMMIEYPFDYRAAVGVESIALAVAGGLALLACVFPVRTALRLTIREALRTE